MKMMKALVGLFAVVAVVAGGITLLTPTKADAKKCCYVMVCTNTPPIVCWEVCKPCPTL